MTQKAIVKQLSDAIKEYPKSIPIEQILKEEELKDVYIFETEKSYLLIKTYENL